MPRYSPPQRRWVSNKEWRKQKREIEESRQAYKKAEQERAAAFEEEAKLRSQRADRLSTKLWAWGVNSEKHPTHSVGIFPYIIMIALGIPILGLLYKLSFGVLGPVMIVAAATIAGVYSDRKSRKK
jgi:hypothetical protein